MARPHGMWDVARPHTPVWLNSLAQLSSIEQNPGTSPPTHQGAHPVRAKPEPLKLSPEGQVNFVLMFFTMISKNMKHFKHEMFGVLSPII